MNTITKRTFVVALGGMFLAGLSFVGSADAAIRDARTKARGDFGTVFWNSQPRTQRNLSFQPQVRRSYSYEPSYRTNRRYRSTPSYSAPKKSPWQYPKTDPRRYRI
jgi:hypothetical protein